MSTASDFAGRRADVLVFQVSAGESPQELFGGDGLARLCAGPQRVAQAYALALLQQQGTVPYAPSEGTGLVAEVASGRIRTDADLVQAFGRANLLAVRQVQTAELDSDPLDERLDYANLAGHSVGIDSVELRVEVFTMAGVSRTVLLPIPSP